MLALAASEFVRAPGGKVEDFGCFVGLGGSSSSTAERLRFLDFIRWPSSRPEGGLTPFVKAMRRVKARGVSSVRALTLDLGFLVGLVGLEAFEEARRPDKDFLVTGRGFAKMVGGSS